MRFLLILGLLLASASATGKTTITAVKTKTVKTNGTCTSSASCRTANGVPVTTFSGTMILGMKCLGYVQGSTLGKCEYTLGFCDDGNVLSKDGLISKTKECSYTLPDDCTSDQTCGDGDPCTTDSCENGGCVHKAQDGCVECFGDDGCDTSIKSACEYVGEEGWPRATFTTERCVPELERCMVFNFGQEYCTNACAEDMSGCAADESPCDDGNPCTEDSFDDFGVCVYEPAPTWTECNDGNPCTSNWCWEGECEIQVYSCPDGNECTDDACVVFENGGAACVWTAVSGTVPCDDGSACTSNDVCANKVCAGTGTDCDDGEVCTTDSCNAAGGCTNTPNAATCDDGVPCTINTQCANGACGGGTQKDCQDNNPCTTDSCDPQTGGCLNVANTATCNDGNSCTGNDICGNKTCSGTAVVCNDNNACTTDSCNPASGCAFAAISGCVPVSGKQANLVNLTTSNLELQIACDGTNPNLPSTKKTIVVAPSGTFNISGGPSFCWGEVKTLSGPSWFALATYEARLAYWKTVIKIVDGAGQEITPEPASSTYDIGFATK